MDIDKQKLDYAKRAIQKIKDYGKYSNMKITATLDRKKALEGADGVVITILQGGVDVWRLDIEIPKKYGVDMNVGDTRSIAGIFRALRTIPVMLDIAGDIDKYCPKAVVLNYTNPMAMLCRAVQERYPDLCFTGLCHSVQGTAKMLANWIGADMSEIQYICAGINHQAWYLRYERNGEDAYPEIRSAILSNPDILNTEQVRNDMYLHLDYFVTESSGHSSEYNPWYRKRPDLIEKYCTHGTGWNPGAYAYIRDEYIARKDTWEKTINDWIDSDEIDLERGEEYASHIFNAMFGNGDHYMFNGNIRNFGIIDNLPRGCCVEVPVMASKRGLDAFKVGSLPEHLAVINNINASCEELTVKGALEGSKKKIYYAVYLDPLTSAVLSLQETESLVDEMFEANKDYLGYLK